MPVAGGRLRVHARGAAILATTLRVPGTQAVQRLGRTLSIEETTHGEVPITVLRPGTRPPWPVLVFVNGATPDGRKHPIVRRLGLGLARAGFLVFVPELPGIGRGELTPATLRSTIELVTAAGDTPEARQGRVGLAGVSLGGSLALLTAAAPALAERITVVACIAPFTDLANIVRLATTGVYRNGDRLVTHAAPPFLLLGIARSLVDTLPRNPANEILASELRAVDPNSGDPLLPFRRSGPLDDGAAALHALLANQDPERFDELYGGLPGVARESVESLSPLRVASRLVAPVEIATAPHDTYFPVAESVALAGMNPRVTLTVTEALAHAAPTLTRPGLAGLVRLHLFFTRSLAAAGASRTEGPVRFW
jgi:pimeloyl-ACP methyl ester carboxylesterase